eukprot:Nitzschia sp. Nitz4//scaffold131_size63436//38917//40200//NITZ4_006278-RA/size63436-processed-gene-0.119-mRNA-1//-1//CDS//3329535277//7706//frame0
MSLPLRGLRVLDLSRILAGPWCTMLLADAGATVVKLERTGTGDDTRTWGPPFLGDDPKNRISTYFISVNRRKKSLAVDMKNPAGLDICRRLATEWADVVVENFKVGTTERMGLDYETLASDNPGLVYCSISGFGSTGPFAERPGYDVVISGMYGLMSITGDEGGPPSKVGVASTDVLTGTLAHSGILSALYERSQTGLGKKVEVSLMETQLAGLVNIASNVLNAPEGTPPPKRWGTAHESIVPYQAFRCMPSPSLPAEEQYVMVGAGNDGQFVKLCEVLGNPQLAKDPRFLTNADRVAHRKILLPLLEERFATQTRDEWVSRLEGKGFPLGPLRSVKESFECEQAIAREVVEEMDHSVAGKIRLPRSPISFSSVHSEAETRDHIENLPPPMLGQHTEEVLTEILKVDCEIVDDLERVGAIERWRAEE